MTIMKTEVAAAPGTLANELAAAEAAAAPLRKQADELAGALDAAIKARDFARAASLQEELPAAQEAAAVAAARVAAIRGARAAVEREREAAARKITDAQREDAANKMLVTAQGDAAASAAQMRAALAAMREAFAAARRHLAAAEVYEQAVTEARGREKAAKAALGYWPAGHPGPPVARANEASRLRETDPLVLALTRARP
jgi:hypothetical protein